MDPIQNAVPNVIITHAALEVLDADHDKQVTPKELQTGFGQDVVALTKSGIVDVKTSVPLCDPPESAEAKAEKAMQALQQKLTAIDQEFNNSGMTIPRKEELRQKLIVDARGIPTQTRLTLIDKEFNNTGMSVPRKEELRQQIILQARDMTLQQRLAAVDQEYNTSGMSVPRKEELRQQLILNAREIPVQKRLALIDQEFNNSGMSVPRKEELRQQILVGR
jgi:hypothetical protein